jgi:hypothetical protein
MKMKKKKAEKGTPLQLPFTSIHQYREYLFILELDQLIRTSYTPLTLPVWMLRFL